MLFYDYWFFSANDPIVLEIEWLNYSLMPGLPGEDVSKDDILSAAENAIETWNEIPYNKGDIFIEYDEDFHDNKIPVWITDDLDNFPLIETTHFAGITCLCVNKYTGYNMSYDCYFSDYEYNEIDPNPPLNGFVGSSVYLNGDVDANMYFD